MAIADRTEGRVIEFAAERVGNGATVARCCRHCPKRSHTHLRACQKAHPKAAA